MSGWLHRSLRGNDPEAFADALIVVEQLAQSLNNLLRERKTLPGWTADPLVLAAERHLIEYHEGPQ